MLARCGRLQLASQVDPTFSTGLCEIGHGAHLDFFCTSGKMFVLREPTLCAKKQSRLHVRVLLNSSDRRCARKKKNIR